MSGRRTELQTKPTGRYEQARAAGTVAQRIAGTEPKRAAGNPIDRIPRSDCARCVRANAGVLRERAEPLLSRLEEAQADPCTIDHHFHGETAGRPGLPESYRCKGTGGFSQPLGRHNRIELPDVIGPSEFNLNSAASSIVTNAANLNILYRLTFDVQRRDAEATIANPAGSRRRAWSGLGMGRDRFCCPLSESIAARATGHLRNC